MGLTRMRGRFAVLLWDEAEATWASASDLWRRDGFAGAGRAILPSRPSFPSSFRSFRQLRP